MKNILILCVVSVFVSGCGWMNSDEGELSDQTSQFVDNGEVAVWYEDADYSISLKLPDSMEGYESDVFEVSEDNIYGTVERVEFSKDGGVVGILSVHKRDMVEANLETFEYVSENESSEYLFSFANALSAESDLQEVLMDMSFNLEDYITFE